MKMHVLFGAALLALAMPQAAQAASEWPIEPAGFVDVSTITIDDGHMLDYANHLAGAWRKSQDYAKSQGWITDYQIWVNQYPRKDEPDVYLVVWFPRFATPEESMKRDEAYKSYMKQTEAQLQAGSQKRATYRHLSGSMLMQNYTWAK